MDAKFQLGQYLDAHILHKVWNVTGQQNIRLWWYASEMDNPHDIFDLLVIYMAVRILWSKSACLLYTGLSIKSMNWGTIEGSY